MDIIFELTVPAKTPEADYIFLARSLPMGTIKQVVVNFPFGCAGLVHIQVFHNEFMLWPSTPGHSYTGNNSEIIIIANYTLEEAWNLFWVKAWNLDEQYAHIPYVRINILPESQATYQEYTMGFYPPERI